MREVSLTWKLPVASLYRSLWQATDVNGGEEKVQTESMSCQFLSCSEDIFSRIAKQCTYMISFNVSLSSKIDEIGRIGICKFCRYQAAWAFARLALPGAEACDLDLLRLRLF